MSKKKKRRGKKSTPKKSALWVRWFCDAQSTTKFPKFLEPSTGEGSDGGEPHGHAHDKLSEIQAALHDTPEAIFKLRSKWTALLETLAEDVAAEVGPALAQSCSRLLQHRSQDTKAPPPKPTEKDSTDGSSQNSTAGDERARALGALLHTLSSLPHKKTAKAARREIHRLKSRGFPLLSDASPERGPSAASGEGASPSPQNTAGGAYAYGPELSSFLSDIDNRTPCLIYRYMHDGQSMVYLMLPMEEQISFLAAQIYNDGVIRELPGVLRPAQRRGFYKQIDDELGPARGEIPLYLVERIFRRALERARRAKAKPPENIVTFLSMFNDHRSMTRHPALDLVPNTKTVSPKDSARGLSHWTLDALDPPPLHEKIIAPIMETGTESGIHLTGSLLYERRHNLMVEKELESFDEDNRKHYAEMLLDTAALLASRQEDPQQARWCVGTARLLKDTSTSLEGTAFIDEMARRQEILWEKRQEMAMQEAANAELAGTLSDDGSPLIVPPGQDSAGFMGSDFDPSDEGPTSPSGLIIP